MTNSHTHQSPVIALTGGIGAGKSYVCTLLKQRGIKVYDCDAAAKRLLRTSLSLQEDLKRLVGATVYLNGILQKPILAKFLLASEANKQAVNNTIHPAVAADFLASDCQWLESAIYFDSGFDKRVNADHVICVSAPLEVRLKRIMQRDDISRHEALAWIQRQLPQEEVVSRSDFEIVNDGQQAIEPQIENIIHQLSALR